MMDAAALLRRYQHIGFRCSKEQARSLRYRAHSTVRMLANERAGAKRYYRLITASKHLAMLRPRARRAIRESNP